ncbi:MAG: hypothetical protein AAGJ79_10085 [Verrucomicrobiota bacterium]
MKFRQALVDAVIVTFLTLLPGTVWTKEGPNLVKEAINALNGSNIDGGMELLERAIAEDPANGKAHYFRGIGHDAKREFAKAAADYEKAIKLGEDNQSELFGRVGISQFNAGEAKKSVAAFDRYVELVPDREAHLWQLGLAHYYAEMFEEGKAQFEVHESVNPNDVENALWHFLCVAKLKSPEVAKEGLLKTGHDSRVPMMELWDLYAGKATEAEVMAAAKAGEPDEKELRNRLCYTHLYLGLHAEVHGKTEKAKKHMKLAAEDYAMFHCMGEVSRVHRKVRGWE